METLEAYLDRKHEELALLNGFLGTPLALRHPVSVVDVIEQKFHVAAALKAEHALHDWALTETAWAHQGRLRAGPFEFSYDYQRADLEVRGPSFYQFDHSAANTLVRDAVDEKFELLLTWLKKPLDRQLLVLMWNGEKRTPVFAQEMGIGVRPDPGVKRRG